MEGNETQIVTPAEVGRILQRIADDLERGATTLPDGSTASVVTLPAPRYLVEQIRDLARYLTDHWADAVHAPTEDQWGALALTVRAVEDAYATHFPVESQEKSE